MITIYFKNGLVVETDDKDGEMIYNDFGEITSFEYEGENGVRHLEYVNVNEIIAVVNTDEIKE